MNASGSPALIDTPRSLETDARRLERRLARLRRSIRLHLLLRAASLLLVAIVVAAFLSLATDRVLRLSIVARQAVAVVLLSLIGWLAWRLLLRPWTVRLPLGVLADLLEKRHPQLGDRLRSSLEFLRDPEVRRQPGSRLPEVPTRHGHPLALAMKRRVVRETIQCVEQLDLSAVVNYPAVTSPLSAAFSTVALVLALVAPLRDTLSVWYERNVHFGDVEWPQRTRLFVEGFSPPDYTLGVPRGDRLLLSVSVEGEPAERVRIRVHYAGEDRRYSLARESDRRFVFEEPQVTEDFTFELVGGDFRSRLHHVRVLERPRVDALALRLEYPEYTARAPETVEGSLGELSVPEGSTVFVSGTASKALRGARLDVGGESIPLRVESARPRSFSGSFKPARGGTARIHLEDVENVPPDRLFSFVLHLVPDRIPTVRARAYGVSAMVTRDARLPLRIHAEDDYGVTALGVAYELRSSAATADADGESSGPDAAGVDAPVLGSDDFPVLEATEQKVETDRVWDLQPLKIEPGTRLEARVTARDNDGLRGPKTGHSSPLAFLVVTVERLGEELLRREVEERRALERALSVERGVRDEIYRALDAAWKRAGDLDDAAVSELAALARTQRQLTRQVESVSQTIAHILAEMGNNRIAEARDTARLADEIITPLETLAAEDMPVTVRRIGQIREEPDESQRVRAGWELAEGVERAIETMEHVLASMRRMEGFTEIVQRLRGIIKTHQEAAAETRRLYEEAVDEIFENDDGEDDGENRRE